METHLFWGQKVKGQGYEAQEAAGVGFGTLVSASFFYSSGFFVQYLVETVTMLPQTVTMRERMIPSRAYELSTTSVSPEFYE